MLEIDLDRIDLDAEIFARKQLFDLHGEPYWNGAEPKVALALDHWTVIRGAQALVRAISTLTR